MDPYIHVVHVPGLQGSDKLFDRPVLELCRVRGTGLWNLCRFMKELVGFLTAESAYVCTAVPFMPGG